MNLSLLREICKTPRLDILHEIKRSDGQTVRSLSTRLGMSYMGIKQHCVALESDGFLAARRTPTGPERVGRPELVYRLTRRAHTLYPRRDDGLTPTFLAAAEELYGPAAPEKLLYLAFRREAEAGREQVDAPTLAGRVRRWVRWRESHLADAEELEEGGYLLTEAHSPYAALHDRYPDLLHRLEEALCAEVLQAQVQRELLLSSCGGPHRSRFRVRENQS